MSLVALSASSVLVCALAAPPEVTFLPATTLAWDVSDDGGVVVGRTASAGFRWTPDGGFVVINGPAAALGTNVVVSGDGLEIAADILDTNQKQHASLWLGGSSWDPLPAFVSCDSFLLNTYDINQDGGVVVGLAWVAGCQAHAFRWDPVNGTVDMGTTVPGRATRANAVSDDGSRIVGWQDQANGQRRGCRWTNLVQSYIPAYTAPGGTNYQVGEALGVSDAGDIVVGYNVFGLSGGNAWKWTAATNTTSLLPQLPGFAGQAALANDVTADGAIVVGTTGGIPIGRKAIIWIDGVAQDLKAYIESLGGSIAPYNSLGTAMAITPDGRTIVGWGNGAGQPAGWIVHFPAACPADLSGDGFVDGADLGVLLAAWGDVNVGPEPADLNEDGTVDGSDLGELLAGWGLCDESTACPGTGDCCQVHATAGCNDETCCESVCFTDLSCCQSSWDQQCVNVAESVCDGCTTATCPGTGDCCAVHAGPGCSEQSCCESVCFTLLSCCETSWDQQCVDIAQSVCAQCR